MRTVAITLLILTLLHATTLYGEIYNGEDFELMNNTVIKISGPTNLQLVSSENYSVDLEPGKYVIETRFYENGTAAYYSKDSVAVAGEKMQFDLVVFPADPLLIDVSDEEIPTPQPIAGGTGLFKNELDAALFLVVVAALIGIVLFFFLRKGDKTKHEPNVRENEFGTGNAEPIGREEQQDARLGTRNAKLETNYELDEDGKRVLKILGENEGRMIQKELRRIMNFSETKMSLVISELEACGLVKRIKKGRENILKLVK